MDDIRKLLTSKYLTDSELGQLASASVDLTLYNNENTWKKRISNSTLPLNIQLENALMQGIPKLVLVLLRDYQVRIVSVDIIKLFIRRLISSIVDELDNYALIANYLLRYLEIFDLLPLINTPAVLESGIIYSLFENPNLTTQAVNNVVDQLPRLPKNSTNSTYVVDFISKNLSLIPFFITASLNTGDRQLIDDMLKLNYELVTYNIYTLGYYDLLDKNRLYNYPCYFVDNLSIDDEICLKLIELNDSKRNLDIDDVLMKRPRLLPLLNVDVSASKIFLIRDAEVALFYSNRLNQDDAYKIFSSTNFLEVFEFLAKKWNFNVTSIYLSNAGYLKYLAITNPEKLVDITLRTSLAQLEVLVTNEFKNLKYSNIDNRVLLHASPAALRYICKVDTRKMSELLGNVIKDYSYSFTRNTNSVKVLHWIGVVANNLELTYENKQDLVYIHLITMSRFTGSLLEEFSVNKEMLWKALSRMREGNFPVYQGTVDSIEITR